MAGADLQGLFASVEGLWKIVYKIGQPFAKKQTLHLERIEEEKNRTNLNGKSVSSLGGGRAAGGGGTDGGVNCSAMGRDKSYASMKSQERYRTPLDESMVKDDPYSDEEEEDKGEKIDEVSLEL